MVVPEELSYTADHEWVRLEPRGARVGITDFAQEALGEVVFVALPELGAVLERGGVLGEVESTKSVSEIYAPLSGTVVSRNESLVELPERLNADPYGEGWICLLDPSEERPEEGLLSAAAYRALTAS